MAGGPQDLSELEKDPRLFLYTSLTAGSSHIVTATSRIETILRANRIPFAYIDTATDEKAKRLWMRRAGKRKLPALVKEGFVIGDLEQVEEWNEFGELKEAIGPCPPAGAPVAPPATMKPTTTAAAAGSSSKASSAPASATAKTTSAAPARQQQQPIALPGAAEIAARNKALPKKISPEDTAKPKTESESSKTWTPAEKEKRFSLSAAKAVAVKGEAADSASASSSESSSIDSRMAAGSSTPAVILEKKDEDGKESKVVEKAGTETEAKDELLSAPASGVGSGAATSAEKKDVEEESTAADKTKYDHLSAPASAIVSGTATPAEKKNDEEEEDKEEKTGAADTTAAPDEKTKYDHLSAPASAIVSGTATPAAEPATWSETVKPDTTVAGSEVQDTPTEEVKKVENETKIPEEPTTTTTTTKEVPSKTDEEVASISKGVEGMQVGDDGKNVGEQEAAKAEDAVKSVED